jgi:GxxExxY protein
MPIIPSHPIEALSETEFHELDYKVMALAFETQNELGRLYDEQIYQNKLKQKCLNNGLKVACEIEIELTHRTYVKSLFVDLLIENAVYELKTIQSIHEPQRIQTLNYLFATNTQHGKIINFRPSSVEHEFVSTTLSKETRMNVTLQMSAWRAHSHRADTLQQRMCELLSDWGAYFDTQLYEKALIHLLGDLDVAIRPVEIRAEGKLLGAQKLNTLSESEFFILTAARNNPAHHQKHLEKLLDHTPFKHLYWINLAHSQIQFTTLEKQSFCPNYSVYKKSSNS